jgi:hypothetical protein
VLALLADLGAAAAPGGPLSEQPGIFWINLPDAALETAATRLSRLGYSEAVYHLEPTPTNAKHDVRWHGTAFRLVSLYQEDPDAARELAPDRRVFMLASPSGEARPVRGYRGDGQALSRRGLPVYDARLLVNLALSKVIVRARHTMPLQNNHPFPNMPMFLDPFAGIGGIVLEVRLHGCRVLSLDVDPALRLGLAQFGAAHIVGNAHELPYADASIDAIATEPPYDEEALSTVVQSLGEMARVLKPDGNLVLLCTDEQAEPLREKAVDLPLAVWLDESVDRKGLGCVVLAWRKV